MITAAYDYMGRRAWKKVETIATDPETGEETATVTLHQRYIHRGYLQVAACDLTRGGHPCLWLITWDPTQPIATRPLGIQKDGTWYCYGWDLTKNICEVYGQAGYIRTTYSYSPYGSVTEEGDVTQPLQWSSEYADPELGLVYYNYRFYNPRDGRWNRRDPLEEYGYLNIYAFIRNGCTFLVDFLGLAGEITHGTKKCTHEDSCIMLAVKASSWIRHYSERYQKLQIDKYDLKNTNPVKYNNHIDKIEEAQNQVKNCLTILSEKIKDKKCCGSGDRKPDSIPNFSPKTLPERVPIPRPVYESGEIPSGVIAGVATVGIGYFIYRIIRLTPSLFPPLWWTLPANVVAP